jgi:ABC-type polysaccharide/polyol phosphate export permease
MAVYVYRMVSRQVISLMHYLLLVVLLWLVFRWHLNWSFVLWPLGIALNVVTVLGMTLLLGVVGARFRDVQLIVSTGLQIAFLLTPVIWEPSTLDGMQLRIIVDANPLYALVEVFRQPLVGGPPNPLTWLMATAVASSAAGCGIACYARHRHRIAFWI